MLTKIRTPWDRNEAIAPPETEKLAIEAFINLILHNPHFDIDGAPWVEDRIFKTIASKKIRYGDMIKIAVDELLYSKEEDYRIQELEVKARESLNYRKKGIIRGV